MAQSGKVTPQQLAMLAAGAFVAVTAVGYVHDNYWDPSKKKRRSRLPVAEKTKFEVEAAGRLPPMALIGRMMNMGDQLKQAKNYKEAEKYYLRLYTLVNEMPMAPQEQAEIGGIVLTHLTLTYKLMRRWDLMATAINELISHHPESLKPSERLEWMFPLVDALSHQRKYSEALSTGEKIKKSLKDLAIESPAQEGPVKRMQFQAQEQMSNVYWAAGDLEKAEKEMIGALSVKGHNHSRALELELNLASLYLVRGETEKAEKTIESWSNRPELKEKTETKKKITIASCYYRANQLEVAESMFTKLMEESTGTDREECVSYLATISHEKEDPKKARSYYAELRKSTTFVRTMSRYLATTSASFTEKGMDPNGVRGKWTLLLQIRALLVKSLPGLKVGNVLQVSVETLEGVEKQKAIEEKKDDAEEKKDEKEKEEDKEKEKKEEEEVEALGKMVVEDVPVTKEMYDQDFLEFHTAETVVPRRKKMLVEVQVFADSSKKEVLGFHYQMVRLV